MIECKIIQFGVTPLRANRKHHTDQSKQDTLCKEVQAAQALRAGSADESRLLVLQRPLVLPAHGNDM